MITENKYNILVQISTKRIPNGSNLTLHVQAEWQRNLVFSNTDLPRCPVVKDFSSKNDQFIKKWILQDM